MDLLLYLVRKQEMENVDIRIAAITDQFLEYLEVLKELDNDAVGDFVAMASTLVEIKSQHVLPRFDEVDEEFEDPREELVRRLLEYKKYRDAASILEEQGRQWQLQYPRLGCDLPARQRDLAEEPIHELELWDLVSAFARILRERELVQRCEIDCAEPRERRLEALDLGGQLRKRSSAEHDARDCELQLEAVDAHAWAPA